MTEILHYRDSDHVVRALEDCSLTQDKAGKYWLWSKQLEQNLAYKSQTKEECLIAAIDSLLFLIQLRDKRTQSLQRIVDLTETFINEVKQEEQNDF